MPVDIIITSVVIIYILVVIAIANAAKNNRETDFFNCAVVGLIGSPIVQILYIFYQPNHKRDRQHSELIEALRNK
ncbi:hypothetical protein CF134_18765 [Aeromonas salmonicida]|uniref:Uncharacterized protein n=1 Tax=Aeromonas salmonicida subsp. pectinolytica 34mel TaxID=1324960 RepID=T0PIF1_AERSA|nr:hypothetical protein [Aeromonas salmonicida]ATP09803.1 uncharacterized protein Asalp_26630 [Aeromonas salmonicida subsp. pectinolytica 34mel]EQC03787.1 hypothetical protein K931_13523 [Aeromonas salmonicida subsp. pectinolytica 34mel]TNI11966.1 hypothetical protein CF134_18765 [Aeromonas salmonicida]